MSTHAPTHCPICQLRPRARNATAKRLANHFSKHGFHPVRLIESPSQWINQWVRGDLRIGEAGTCPRNHVEKRMRQIEALAQVDAFARDSLSRLELDMAWRRWKEGLTRTLALGYVRRWEMGDEMPTPTELRDFLKNHFTDSPHEKLNMAAALQDRFRESPPVAPSILMDKIHALWLFLPTHHPEGRWLFDENPGVAAISWWRWTALRLFGSRLAHLPVDARLLPWLAAASLPSSSGLPLLDSAASSLWFTAAAWPADLHLDMLGRAWAGFPGPIAAGLSALALQGHTPPAAAPPAPPARL